MAETAASSKKVPEITKLAEHNSAADLWVAIEGKCCDLTKFKDNHPGGHRPLEGMAGRNATEPFENFLPAFVWKVRKLRTSCSLPARVPAYAGQPQTARCLLVARPLARGAARR